MTEPQLDTLDTTTATAVITAVVPKAEMTGFFDRAFSELGDVLGQQGNHPIAPPFAKYLSMPGETVELEVGFPVSGPVAPEGRVHPGTLPAGRVARMVHAGSYDELNATWSRLGAWIVEQGLTPGSDVWEVYVTEPNPEMDPAELRTELFWTIQ